jgi:hypothetical protein
VPRQALHCCTRARTRRADSRPAQRAIASSALQEGAHNALAAVARMARRVRRAPLPSSTSLAPARRLAADAAGLPPRRRGAVQDGPRGGRSVRRREHAAAAPPRPPPPRPARASAFTPAPPPTKHANPHCTANPQSDDGVSFHGVPRFYRNSLVGLRRALAAFASERVAFALNLGDSVDGKQRGDPEAGFRAVTACFEGLPYPCYHLVGRGGGAWLWTRV